MRKIILLLCAVLITAAVSAQNFSSLQMQAVNVAFQGKGELVIKFTVPTKTQINEDLTHIISIDDVKALTDGSGYEVTAYVNPSQFQNFLTRNIPYSIVPKDAPKALTMATTVAGMANWDAYPTYSVYEQMMLNYATNYPSLCHLDTILPSTPNGHNLLVLKITNNINIPANKPQFLYASTMHGNEETGYVLMLRLIDFLLNNYGTNSRVTNIVNNVELWICPLENPDGTYHTNDNILGAYPTSTRENGHTVDLNRNYPYIGGSLTNQDSNGWEPETKAFIKFAKIHHINMSVNFHDGSEVVNYPWDTWTKGTPDNHPHPDDAWMLRVSRIYADTVHANSGTLGTTYFTDETNGVTEGGDWYTVDGGRQDYMTYFWHDRESTIELASSQPAQSQNLPAYWNAQYHSFIKYIEESEYGIRGIITDSCSGLPIQAKVYVNSHEVNSDSSFVYSGLPIGDYHRYLINGTYSVTYSATGYTSKTITGVTLANGAATVRNIQLTPTAAPDAQFTGTITDACAGTVQFTNNSAASTSFLWNFGDGTTSTATNPSHTYTTSGTYTVKLYATNCKGNDSLVRTNYLVISMTTAPTVTGASICGMGAITLNASGSGTLNWYDAASGGTLVNTGTTYDIPSLSSTTTYYVTNSTATPDQFVGKPDSIGGGAMYTNTTYWLLFDCSSAVILKSVNVYSSAAGNRTITMNSSTGAVLATATVNIPVGLSTVTLNFNVPVGTGMSLRCTTTPNMYRSSGGITFPYSIAGKISITGTNASTTRYYFFYNWEIETPGGCESVRVPVVATVSTMPVAGFTYGVGGGGSANFTNTTTNGTTYLWSFGDGGSTTQTNPTHVYTANGNYTVQLIANNGSCSDTTSQQVNVTTVGISENPFSSVSIYPNPVQGEFTIDFGTNNNKTVNVEIFSMRGQLLYSKIDNNTALPLNIDMTEFAGGVYTIELRSDSDQKFFKVFKSN